MTEPFYSTAARTCGRCRHWSVAISMFGTYTPVQPVYDHGYAEGACGHKIATDGRDVWRRGSDTCQKWERA